MVTAPRQAPGLATRHLENVVLFAAAADAPPPARRGEDWAALDWDYLARAAGRQGVAPLLHAWLERHGEIAVPGAADPLLRSAYWATHFRNRALL